jgi:hypothetical protein
MKPTQDMVWRAQQELAAKTPQQIHQETAISWAARFLAARSMSLHGETEDYRHEAIEHAALAGDLDLVSYLLSF